MSSKGGSLTRANKLIHGGKSSVFTLDHWSSANGGKNQQAPATNHRLQHRLTNSRAQLLLVKAQELALNFLLRWSVLFEQDQDEQQITGCATRRRRRRSRGGHSIGVRGRIKSEDDKNKRSRSSLLFYKAAELPDRRLKSILKFIFWRWMTWTNVLELVLVVTLVCCCIYQCYGPLVEYYKYPTYVSVSKVMNDNFRKDLPAITFCNKNRMSKSSIKANYPHLNESHFLAITLGSFISKDNYSLPPLESLTVDKVNLDLLPSKNFKFRDRKKTAAGLNGENEKYKDLIDWIKVTNFLSNNSPGGSFSTLPDYDMIEKIICANIWGDRIPCDKLVRIPNLQGGAYCVTLFHVSRMLDKKSSGVSELDIELENQFKDETTFADNFEEDDTGMDLIEIDEELWNKEDYIEKADELNEQVAMNTREVVRLKINFNRSDYLDTDTEIGTSISIHSNTDIGHINHVAYRIEPGFWYNYYIERFDYKRLPAPYDTNCKTYIYKEDYYDEKTTQKLSNVTNTLELIERQSMHPEKLLDEYAASIQYRSSGSVSRVIFLSSLTRRRIEAAKPKFKGTFAL